MAAGCCILESMSRHANPYLAWMNSLTPLSVFRLSCYYTIPLFISPRSFYLFPPSFLPRTNLTNFVCMYVSFNINCYKLFFDQTSNQTIIKLLKMWETSLEKPDGALCTVPELFRWHNRKDKLCLPLHHNHVKSCLSPHSLGGGPREKACASQHCRLWKPWCMEKAISFNPQFQFQSCGFDKSCKQLRSKETNLKRHSVIRTKKIKRETGRAETNENKKSRKDGKDKHQAMQIM